MKVKELIAKLQKLENQDADILVRDDDDNANDIFSVDPELQWVHAGHIFEDQSEDPKAAVGIATQNAAFVYLITC